MLDTRSSEAPDLIAGCRHHPDSDVRRLALLANELLYERNEAEAQRDAALARAAVRTECADPLADCDDLWFGLRAAEAQLERSVPIERHEQTGRGLS